MISLPVCSHNDRAQRYYASWRGLGIPGNMIQRPYVLADIQQDLSGLPSNVYSSDVFAIAGSKKRKRSELALAIDRQGIDIYDVSLHRMFQNFLKRLMVIQGTIVKADHILYDISAGCLYLPSVLN